MNPVSYHQSKCSNPLGLLAPARLDLERLVVSLDNTRHGNERRWRDLAGNERSAATTRVLRVLQREMTENGLIQFYRDRGLMTDRVKLRTRIHRVVSKPRFQVVLSASTLLSLAGPAPVVVLPGFNRFRVSPSQLETLLLNGVKSPEGQRVMSELMPRNTSDVRLNLFIRGLNRALFVGSFIVLYQYLDEIDGNQAKANGDRFAAALDKAIADLEKKAGPVETVDDIHYDKTVASLEAEAGKKLTEADRREVCTIIAAPHRCVPTE